MKLVKRLPPRTEGNAYGAGVRDTPETGDEALSCFKQYPLIQQVVCAGFQALF
ncbi:MAG: hypothetical protein OSB69_12755 [Alphaproteobacteria bacterium]|nr:hypothetical protein [Alphaproteobacteria bacterium]